MSDEDVEMTKMDGHGGGDADATPGPRGLTGRGVLHPRFANADEHCLVRVSTVMLGLDCLCLTPTIRAGHV